MLLTEITTLDALLNAHAGDLGGDFKSYRNHTYRVANLCVAFSSNDAEQVEKIAVAAAFHDMGIWTNHTFDYLEPSVSLAGAYLARTDRTDWIPEITEMIRQHHKISPYRSEPQWLVEPFRRSDWTDVSRGLFKFGLPGGFLRQLYARWPGAGFHRRLVQLELRQFATHPWKPLPMVRL